MSLTRNFRAEEVSAATPNFDLLLLAGTQRRLADPQVHVQKIRHNAHLELAFGWSRGRGTDRSAGTSMYLGRRFRESHIAATYAAPADVRGRGGALRLRAGTADVLALCLYAPPVAGGAGAAASRLRTLDTLFKWAMRDERMGLIRQRWELRFAMHASDDEAVEEVQMRLARLSMKCRRLRQRQSEQRDAELAEEVAEAWRHRRFAELHRLRRLLARNGKGPKKRVYCRPPSFRPSLTEWQEYWAQEGGAGGQRCVVVNCEQEKDAPIEAYDWPDVTGPAVWMQGLREQVTEDVKGIAKYMRSAGKRRAAPAWSAPLEAWLMLLRPAARVDRRLLGVGAVAGAQLAPVFRACAASTCFARSPKDGWLLLADHRRASPINHHGYLPGH